MAELTHKNLSKLSDAECTNVLTTKNMYRLIKKYSNLSSTDIDCWTHGKHYVKFDLENNKFKWTDSKGGFILNSSDELYTPFSSRVMVLLIKVPIVLIKRL